MIKKLLSMQLGATASRRHTVIRLCMSNNMLPPSKYPTDHHAPQGSLHYKFPPQLLYHQQSQGHNNNNIGSLDFIGLLNDAISVVDEVALMLQESNESTQ